MPEEGLEWLDNSELLTFEEIERVVSLLVKSYGVTSVRLTGGEPALRPGLPKLIESLSCYKIDLAMTTNGSSLLHTASDLKQAGLKRLNISIDTLDKAKFVELTKRDQLDHVLKGIHKAIEVGFEKIKLNVVLMKGENDKEICDFLEFGRKHNVVVRFIEFMPLDAQKNWENNQVVSEKEILEIASSEYNFKKTESGSSPSTVYKYSDGSGEFGIIPSVTRSFCDTCDRIRLTADGQIRNCLFALGFLDIKSLLRSGSSDSEIGSEINNEISKKWAGHSIGQVHFLQPSKSMSQVGG